MTDEASAGGDAEAVPENAKAQVFISYSRADAEVAAFVRRSLRSAGFYAYLDVHDIAKSQNWRERIGQLITRAEKIVFLISPDSVDSEIARWEVDTAVAQGKDVAPVLIRETDAASVPEALRRLNYIFARDAAEQASAVAELVVALERDLPWEQEKARLNYDAVAWRSAQEPSRLLILSRAAIEAAEAWRDRQPRTAPPPSDVLSDYINASRRRLTARSRRLAIAAVAAAVAFAALGAVSLDLSMRARLSEAVALLRSGETAAATDRMDGLLSEFLFAAWRRTEAAEAAATAFLGVPIAVAVRPPARGRPEVFADRRTPTLSEGSPVLCAQSADFCVRRVFMDAHLTRPGFQVGSRARLEASDAWGETEASRFVRDSATVFHSQDVGPSAYAVEPSGAFVAVSDAETVQIWRAGALRREDAAPWRRIVIDAAVERIAFLDRATLLVETVRTAEHAARFRIIQLEPRRMAFEAAGEASGYDAPDSSAVEAPLDYDPASRELTLPGAVARSVTIEAADLADALAAAVSEPGSPALAYRVRDSLYAISLGSGFCERLGPETPKPASAADHADLALIRVNAAGDALESAAIIACGPTQRAEWGDFHRLTIAQSRPARRDRIFVAGRRSYGFIELTENGAPVALYGAEGRPQSPDRVLEGSETPIYVFEAGESSDLASVIFYLANSNRIVYVLDDYSAPRGNIDVVYLSLRYNSHGVFERRIAQFDDRVVTLSAAASGRAIEVVNEVSGSALYVAESAQFFPAPAIDGGALAEDDAHSVTFRSESGVLRWAAPEFGRGAVAALADAFQRARTTSAGLR